MFDPAALKPFDVIQVYYEFKNEPPDFKYFVVIAHHGEYLICIKSTTRTALYENDKRLMDGCVCVKEGECDAFPQKSIIDPENQVPLSYSYLVKEEERGRFKIKGKVPDAFREKLLKAIEASIKLSPVIKKRLFTLLAEQR